MYHCKSSSVIAHKMKVCTLLILLLEYVKADSCPTWFTNSTGSCECGFDLNGYIKCHPDTFRVDIAVGRCMTMFDNKSVVAGSCQYAFTSNVTSRVYSAVSDDPLQLSHQVCGRYNRAGLLCGECSDGFGPSPFYSVACVSCSTYSSGVAISLYLLLVLLPTSVFFLSCGFLSSQCHNRSTPGVATFYFARHMLYFC